MEELTNKKKIMELYYWCEEDMYESIEVINAVLQKMLRTEEEFLETLTEEQKQKFKQLEELKNEKGEETDKKIFTYAFSLGIRLLLESIDKI